MNSIHDFFIENENKIIGELEVSALINQLNLPCDVIERADLIAIYIVDISKFIIVKDKKSKCPYIVDRFGFSEILDKSFYPIIEEVTFLGNKQAFDLTKDFKIYRIGGM